MSNFFGSIFEFLFKYTPVTFSRGEFAFGAPHALALIVVLSLAAAGLAVVTYRRVGARSAARDRSVLTAIRVGAILLLMFCLMRPMLVLSMALPQRNFVGILMDDSRSMAIADEGKERRGDVAQKHFVHPDSRLVDELKEKFLIRYYTFSSAAARTGAPEDMTYEGGKTRLMDAIERAQQDMSAVPVAGFIVVTDGADNAQSPMADQLLKLKASGVPLYPVGVGRTRFDKDVEISRVEAPHLALKGASIIVDLFVTQHGFTGQKKRLTVEDGGRIVSEQEITLPAEGEVAPVRVHVTAEQGGPRNFKFKVEPSPGELLIENNEQYAQIVVNDRREKILYFEGEPRWESRFLLQSLQDDENLQVVMMVQTADNKFFRKNVDDGEELAGGFPTTREELYKYRSVILGSVDASFFTHDQLQMLADFVSDRGGGLLLLGGRLSFSEGGYYGTPLADALPVTFGMRRMTSAESEDDTPYTEIRVELTPAGRIHPATRLAANEDESADKWKSLPAVTTVNSIDELKPGATELISGTSVRGRGHYPVLVFQRYGRGKVLAMPIQDSWLWQMAYEMDVEDLTHETLWKQVTRWLVTGVPRPVNIAAERDEVAPKEGVVLRAEVSDPRYVHLNDARVTAYVSGPGMPETEIPMEWAVDRDGEYRASFTPNEEGEYRVRAQAWKNDSLIAVDTTFVRAAQPRSEYFGAEMNEQLLKRIAKETGGKFYTPDKLGSMAEDMTYTKSGAVTVQQLDLWDMPFIFVVLIGLIGSEWIFRKFRGLA
jgi:uncharacterized membrane protein